MTRHWLIVGGLLTVFYFLARGTAWYGPYTYDEADYMYAVSLGWRGNWLDSPSLPFLEFVRIGFHRGNDASARLELSENIRDSNDVVFYRHWHGPLYTDWLRILRQFDCAERSTRILNAVFPIAATLLMYFGALWVVPGPAGRIAAILSSVLYLWSFPVIRTTELTPHQLFAVCVVATLLPLVKLFGVSASARRYWYAAVVGAALAFCVLEVAFALIFSLLICGYIARERLRPDLPFAARSIAAFLATVLIIWPAAVFKMSFIKAYFFMTYLAVFRPGAWGADLSIGETWRLRFVNSPVPWVVLTAALVFFFKGRAKAAALIPPAVFSALMFLNTLPVKTDLPRYTLPLFPAVVLFAALSTGLVADRWRPSWRFAAVVLICAAMLATSWPKVRTRMPVQNRRAEAVLALVRVNSLPPKILLVPHEDIPMVHYYFPASRFKTYYDESAIPDLARKGSIDGVIYRGDPPRFVPVAAVVTE
jgi:hypothetical protein